MSRARRATRIAATAAYGGGMGAAGAGAVGLATYGLLRVEASLARRVVGTPFDDAPASSGTYGAGFGEPIRIVVLGDSSAKGMGVADKEHTIGGIVSTAVAALQGHPVELLTVAVVGAQSTDLDRQVEEALTSMPTSDLALILVGANDVTHRLDRATAVRHLSDAVRRLRSVGTEVVVGTCPDLGVIRPLRQPLRLLAQRWSRDLAAAQTVAVVEAGGRTVSLGDLIGPDFHERPSVMFSEDQFHPSSAGYARAAAALLPSVLDALGMTGPDTGRRPDAARGEGIGPVSVAAQQAVREPGTEVSGTAVGGKERGRGGRWAVLLRRQRTDVPGSDAAEDTATEDDRRDASRADEQDADAGLSHSAPQDGSLS